MNRLPAHLQCSRGTSLHTKVPERHHLTNPLMSPQCAGACRPPPYLPSLSFQPPTPPKYLTERSSKQSTIDILKICSILICESGRLVQIASRSERSTSDSLLCSIVSVRVRFCSGGIFFPFSVSLLVRIYGLSLPLFSFPRGFTILPA